MKKYKQPVNVQEVWETHIKIKKNQRKKKRYV